ncbi:hypothetical protein AURDEDRAFT_176517 [Auricularia subglabra TFB-10046 SS5]|uniref:Uncharacterized protein n=1 Tax=Auricularia subglabra (strain TFB-10046 / SS5) TaxID=717982 RepID=J0D6G2_AURST|nr:hypothetical protein AURDEDRAFT_176517 [Auricularia subglabra TFB-10046 SS5]
MISTAPCLGCDRATFIEDVNNRVCAPCWDMWQPDVAPDEICLVCGARGLMKTELICGECWDLHDKDPSTDLPLKGPRTVRDALDIYAQRRTLVDPQTGQPVTAWIHVPPPVCPPPVVSGAELSSRDTLDLDPEPDDSVFRLLCEVMREHWRPGSSYPGAKALNPSRWRLPVPTTPCEDKEDFVRLHRAHGIHWQVVAAWTIVYPFLISPVSLCVNHYVLGQHAVGHSLETCPLVGRDNVRHAVVHWGDQTEMFWQASRAGFLSVKKRPAFSLPVLSKSVCFSCFLPVLLHGGSFGNCPVPDVLPQLLFMYWVHHRQRLVHSSLLPEVDGNTTFAKYWSMLKLPDKVSYPNLIRYALHAVAHLGLANLGLTHEPVHPA